MDFVVFFQFLPFQFDERVDQENIIPLGCCLFLFLFLNFALDNSRFECILNKLG